MCECVKQFNEQLASRNTKISEAWILGDNRMVPLIATVKLNEKKRGRPVEALASFCPFCGTSLAEKLSKRQQRPRQG